MVITRSQSSRNRQIDTENMDRTSDNESETSFPELLSREQMVDLDSDDVLTRRQNSSNYDIDRRFNEINRQIGDLTNIVLTLTNQFASVNGEGNRLNPVTTSTDSRSDSILEDGAFLRNRILRRQYRTGFRASSSPLLSASVRRLSLRLVTFL